MKPHNLFNTDDRAVSPVIGVILMVAITVILAAVIGTFVLGLGDSLGDSQPSAQLDIDDSTADEVTLSHDGGDEVDLDDLDIVAYNDGTSVDRATVSNINNGTATIGSIRLSVGDSVTMTYATAASNPVDSVQIIHTPSESIILESNVDIDNFDGWDTS